MQIKSKDYYDFNLKVDILLKSEGIAGVAFRIQNEFNYYAFVVDKTSGYKAIVKVINSEVSILKAINDGGILLGNWHHLVINAEANKITAFIYDKEVALKTSTEKKIEIEDSTFIHGTVGLFINNIKGFLFDDLKVEPLKCWTPWQPKEKLKILNINTNIYSEEFTGNLFEKYYKSESEENLEKDGPASWELVNDYIEHSYILQKSLVYDLSPRMKPSFLILKDKNFENGQYRITFEALKGETGVISIIFKYQNQIIDNLYSTTDSSGEPIEVTALTSNNSEQFYSLDFVNKDDTNNSNSYWVLRKFNGENFSMIKQKYLTKEMKYKHFIKSVYELNKKVDVVIQAINDKISIKVSYDNKLNFIEVATIVEDAIRFGHVGFGTWKTSARFQFISLEPPLLSLTNKDNDNIMSSDASDIPIPSITLVRKTALQSPCAKHLLYSDLDPMRSSNHLVSLLNSSLGKDFCNKSPSDPYVETSPSGGHSAVNNRNSKSNSSNEKGKIVQQDINITKQDSDFVARSSWKTCVITRNISDRNKYCEDKSSSEIIKQQCKVN